MGLIDQAREEVYGGRGKGHYRNCTGEKEWGYYIRQVVFIQTILLYCVTTHGENGREKEERSGNRDVERVSYGGGAEPSKHLKMDDFFIENVWETCLYWGGWSPFSPPFPRSLGKDTAYYDLPPSSAPNSMSTMPAALQQDQGKNS